MEDLRDKTAGTDDCTAFAIELDGEVVGLIQYHEEDDEMYRHAGIDLFLSEQVHGRGLGTDAVRTMAQYLIRDRGHHRLVIDPAADNVAAIRAYEKAGFKPVGVMRRYERLPGGEWHDGLLMDLLADELRA
jgi:aminoglycoside 6'-N-acetyltransferase